METVQERARSWSAAGLVLATGLTGFLVGPYGAFVIVSVASTAVAAAFLFRGGGPMRISRSPPVNAPPDELRSFDQGVLPWVLVCVVLRVGMVVGLNASDLWRYFAPDAVYYQLSGQALLDYWADPTATASMIQWLGSTDSRPFYSLVNAGMLVLTDDPRWAMSLINTLVCLVVGWVVGKVAQDTYGPRAGRTAFLLTIFFPSLLVWSSMNIREVWSYLVIALLLLSALRIRRSFDPRSLLLLLLCLVWMHSIRPYLVPLLVGAVLMSYVVVRVRQLPYALVGLIVVAGFVQLYGESLGISTDLVSTESLEQVHQMRLNLAFGGSAYGQDVDTRTIEGSLAYLPEGIIRFLFAPFPWTVDSFRQALTVPESLAWYFVSYITLRGVLTDVSHRFSKVAVVLFAAILMTGAYALVSGNEGTAYRHRAQVMLLAFVFAGGEFARRRALRRQRRASA